MKQSIPLNRSPSIPLSSAAVATAAATTTTTATSVAATATATILTRLRLVDRQAAASMFLVVEGVDGRKGIGVGRHLDEAEATTPTSLAILDHLSASYLTKWREQLFQVGIRDREGKIADVQLLAHLRLP